MTGYATPAGTGFGSLSQELDRLLRSVLGSAREVSLDPIGDAAGASRFPAERRDRSVLSRGDGFVIGYNGLGRTSTSIPSRKRGLR